MNVIEIKNQMHMEEWAKLIEAREASGLSIKRWCAQNSLPESKYYYYLKKLRLTVCEPLAEEASGTAQFALVPKPVRTGHYVPGGTSNIKITLPGAVVEIDEGASEAKVKFILEVLLNAQ